MYDLHAHILPGVDDGAKVPEDTIEMARVAADNGTKVVLATPHRKDITENWSVPYIQELIANMNAQIQDNSIQLELVLGMENHLDVDLPDEVTAGRALPMNGSRYILVEMPFFGRPNYIEDALFKLQLQGLTPVLAHPERIEAFQQDPELLVSFVERGMLSQITGGSITGRFGGRVKGITHNFMRRNLAHIIASDTHHAHGPRSPKLPDLVDAAADVIGQEAAQAMVVQTPKAILENQDVTMEQPIALSETKRWWKFW